MFINLNKTKLNIKVKYLYLLFKTYSTQSEKNLFKFNLRYFFKLRLGSLFNLDLLRKSVII